MGKTPKGTDTVGGGGDMKDRPVLADKNNMKKNYCVSIFLLGLFLVLPGISFAAETSAPRPTSVILEEISLLLGNSKFNDAVALFDTINPQDAASSQIKLLKASVLNSGGKTSEARKIAEEVAVREPNNLDALFVLSAIEARAGRTKEQQAVLENILKVDPKNITALLDLGTLHLQTRAISNAVARYDQALEIAPDNMNALLSRAQIYRLHRDPYNAELLINKAVSLYPNEAAPYHERARLYKGAGFPIQALADLDKAKERDSNNYWIAFDRGEVLMDFNRKAEALVEFERAAGMNPNEFMNYVYIAGIKDELGDYDGAEKAYEILAKLKPDYYFAFEGVGMHKMRRGQWLEARDAFAEAYRQAPNEYYYALLAAANWMRSSLTGPRQFLNQAMTKVKRDSIEYFMLRLYYDLTARTYNGENDMLIKIERETDKETKARMLFYMALYYDIRGIPNLANRYFQQFKEMDYTYIPEWRLNEWILGERGLLL